jgi:hypothetical protein
MKSALPLRAFQWDIARQVERLDVLLGLLPKYADWGYQELYLHLEDAIEYPSFPDIARSDAYTQKQMGKLVDTAGRHGIKVVPIVNLLGHTQYLIKTSTLRDLNELRDESGNPLERGQICPLHPRTLEAADRLLRDVAPFCTAGKVHVGLDESFHLGRCPACRAEIEKVGLGKHFAGYVQRLRELTRKQGLRLGIWADMLNFVPKAIGDLPPDLIAYDWYYYPFRKEPKVEFFNFADSDLAGPLQARGIEYWGCPMNGAFRYEPLPLFSDRLANIRSWWNRCRQTKAGGFLVTSWEAYRLAFEMCTVVDAAAAELWLNPTGDMSDEAMLTAGFSRVFGKAGARPAARAALSSDQYPFAGYARWETNNRWDGTVPEAQKSSISEAAWFRKLRKKKTPAPLRESLGFRHYLAEREVFVQSAAAGVSKLRRASRSNSPAAKKRRASLVRSLMRSSKNFAAVLADGRRCARAMWRRTRDGRVEGHNEAILKADSMRLRAWNRWLRECAQDAKNAFTASPVQGPWQLQFTVLNFAPAVQRVVVSRQVADGSWEEICGRHTIEFQGAAARRRTNIARAFAVAVDDDHSVTGISVHGVGQVAIQDIKLTNGVTTLHHPGPRKVVLGQRAPKAGFPDVFHTPPESEILVLKFKRPSR